MTHSSLDLHQWKEFYIGGLETCPEEGQSALVVAGLSHIMSIDDTATDDEVIMAAHELIVAWGVNCLNVNKEKQNDFS